MHRIVGRSDCISLGPRPLERYPVFELPTSRSPVEIPVDFQLGAIGAMIPSSHFAPQLFEAAHAALPQTLSRHHTDLDFCLVQPTAMHGRVVQGEAIPQLFADFDSVPVSYTHLTL